ncbi:ARABIDOPSIS THALIANA PHYTOCYSTATIN 6, cystatin B [Hibiscus trionum]|uniref:ARABIDOPSIS THALIANA PHYTOCYSTATIN 6, cystatin B n=1 Tax=Hibiscus trionum TaxID=183268 RepID=A0A9W7MCX1_HIBTR|nr:ARABIDOPSIS THALIANA PHYTOCYSTATIN 6, cystatin B [Hibiscus trionum]
MARTELAILALSSMFTLLFTAVNGQETPVGGISDATTDQGVQELGKFAVDEYNKQKGTEGNPLEFSQVVQATKLGDKNYLKIEASDKGEKQKFNAEILVKPSGENEMLSFAATKH